MQDTNHQSRITNHAGYEIRENEMLLNNEQLVTKVPVGAVSTAMRIATKVAPTSLLALAALLFVPQAALADNECGADDPTVNGSLADSYDCPDADYPEGVTYAADGDLTVNFTNAGSPARSTIGTSADGDGIDLNATGADSITFDSATTGTELQNLSGLTGAVLSVTTVNGNIDIDTEEIDGDTFSAANVTHGIFAQSTGAGSIDISNTNTIDVSGGSTSTDTIGIEALTGSGAIDITTNAQVLGDGGGIRAISSSGDISIVTNSGVGSFGVDDADYGIQAQTGGAGALSITAANEVRVGNNSTSGIAIDAATGTGLLSIDIVSTGSTVAIVGADAGIRAIAGGDVQIDIGSGRSVTGDVALDLNVSGATTVDNAGTIRGGSAFGEFAIVAGDNSDSTDDSLVLTNDNTIDGAMNFSGLSGGYTFDNNGAWDIRAGAATGNLAAVQRISDLGEGTINNAGTIQFGRNKEVIQAQGATFNGLTASTLRMPATLQALGQDSCTASDPVTGCLDLTGGTTTGQTEILITIVAPPLDPAGDLSSAANAGVLLVDVTGGTSAADHFVLDPGSDNYAMDSFYGSVIDTGGILDYTLLYNPETQEHLLATVPQQAAVEYAAFNQEVLSMWHATADALVARQAELREGAARGGWVRVVSDSSERESTPVVTTQGNTFTYEQNYDLDTTAVMFGEDMFSGENHIIGWHTGLVRSHLEFDGSPNRDRTKGAAAGVYGSWWSDLGPGQLTLDGALNGNFLRLKHQNDFEVTDSDVRTIGLRAEAGWLFTISEMFYVQPLVSAAYARANIETLRLRENKLRFKEVNSERVGGGLRLGGGMDLSGNRFGQLKYWLTARAWEENAEDGSADFQTTGDPLSIEDDISESVEEVSLGVSLTSPDNDLNVFLSGGVQSGDQTDSTNVTIGARLRW